MSSGAKKSSPPNEFDKHLDCLGRLVGYLQSLELLLRFFLVNRQPNTEKVNYQRMEEGDLVAEDPFTNWDTLGQLIDTYNQDIQSRHCSLCVDKSVVNVRDALAHGRVWAASPSGPWRLLKFDPPNKGQVRVLFATEMDALWFGNQVKLIAAQAEKIKAASKLLNMDMVE